MKKDEAYPCMTEEDGSCLTAEEPVCASAYNETFTQQTDSLKVPGLPETWDDLLDCLKEGEEELERGESIPWEMATQNMRSHIADYVA